LVLIAAALACGRVAFDERAELPDAPVAPDATAPTCAAGFGLVAGEPARYRFEPVPTDWNGARIACEAFGAGHAFALPASDSERLALSTMARGTVIARWWIGGTDAAVEGTWVTTTGAPISYLPWAMFEPNNSGGNENCLDILADPTAGAGRVDLYDDRACSALYPFICVCTL
jgi:hypothetical protein